MRQKITCLFITFAFVFIMVGCNDTEESAENNTEETSIPVEVGEVNTGNFHVEKSVYGRTAPYNQTPVMLEQPAEIKTLKVENGDSVKKDDQLVIIKTPMGDQTIKATTKGEVAELDVQEGSFQSNEEPLLVLIDLDKVKATFSVSQSMRELVKKGDKVDVEIKDKKFEGKVLAMNKLPEDSGQYPVKIEINNEDGEILPGAVAQLSIKEQKVKDTIIIPTEAVVSDADDTFIFIANGDHAKRVSIEVLATQTDTTAIKADVKKGDKVIIKGQHTLGDNSLIEVKEGKTQ